MSDAIDSLRERQLRRNVEARSDKLDGYLELASLLFDTSRFEEAVSTLRQALGIPFDNVTRATLLYALGNYVHTATGTSEEPRKLGQQALKLTQGVKTTVASIARAKAQFLVAECVYIDDSSLARQLAASALSSLDQILEEDAIPESGDRLEVLLATARLNCLLGRFDEASRRYTAAFQASRDRMEELYSLIELGTCYREAGRLNEAERVFIDAIAYKDTPPFGLIRPYYELGLIQSDLGKKAEARAKVRKAIDLLQTHPALPRHRLSDLLRSYGEISYDLEDMDEAVRSFQSAVNEYAATDPMHWNSLLWLAYAQRALGQNEDARKNAMLVKRSLAASSEDRAHADALLEAIKTGK
jgi:tetratricopeptide (TPR) repeat protein